MARILVSVCMVRYPLGGMICNSLQWLYGLHRLGHECYILEKANYPNACFNPLAGTMDDNGAYGLAVVSALLARIGLENRLCFVDYHDNYHGLAQAEVDALFRKADLYIDYGNHGAWLQEASSTQCRIFVDGEPGYRQIQLVNEEAASGRNPLLGYHYYYTVGQNIGTAKSCAPTGGFQWRHVFHPICIDLFKVVPASAGAPFTTVMNWQSHTPIPYKGAIYGQKDLEFEKFLSLPRLTSAVLEVAVGGHQVPTERLLAAGWRLRSAHDVTISYDSFLHYICKSQGEFSVCKNVFVATNSGWFSDRSAAYLASGRPVVLQETGFSGHLPCGRGLFAVKDAAQAAEAIRSIEKDYQKHSQWAREIANEHFDSAKVWGRVLSEVGMH